MNKQLEFWTWYDKETVKFNYGSLDQHEWAQKGWEAARDKILEILDKNENFGEEQYGKNAIEYIYYLKNEIYQKIKNL